MIRPFCSGWDWVLSRLWIGSHCWSKVLSVKYSCVVLSVSEPFEAKTTDFTICTDFSLIWPTLGLLGLLIQKPMYCYSPFQDCPYDKNFFVSSFWFYGETIVKSADFFIFGNLVIFFRFVLWSYSLQKPMMRLYGT